MSIKTVTNEYLLNLVGTYKLSATAEDYVREALMTEPSREVGEHARKNVTGAYSSASQGITIQYESHTAELAWLLRHELDPDVVGFRDQPPMVQIRKADKNGVMRNLTYTPDFLLFQNDTVVVVEVKTVSNLRQLAEKYPEQWKCRDGAWVYVPAEEAFHEKGLVHRVYGVDTTQSIETNNLKTLLQANRMAKDVVPCVERKLLKALDESAWLSLSDLQAQVPESSYSDIYLMILNRQIFTNLRSQVLTDTKSCFVATDPSLLLVREDLTFKAPAIGRPTSTSLVPDKAELERALARLERVESGDKSRHGRRLRKLVEDSKAIGKTAIQALIMPRKGNSEDKIHSKVRTFAREHIQSEYMTGSSPKSHAAWTSYKLLAKTKHPDFKPVSLTTYKRFIGLEDSEEVAESRAGKRAGNAASSATAVLDRALIATRPFERFSNDHTKLKILVKVCESNEVEYTRKPWLSALIDESSDYWITSFLTIRDPSKRSISMLYRNCVREYGRLPEQVHSDRGSDLRSVYYRGLNAHFGITASWNPSGHSRFNSVVERLNKQIKDRWISRRAGNTVDYKETRKYSKGFRPQDKASMSIDDLFAEIEVFRHWYNQTIIGTESESPEQKFRSGLDKFEFSGIPVNLDDDFFKVTAIDTDKKDYKIGPSGEIVYNGLHFHHPELRGLVPTKKRTELRIDPEDPYRIYFKVGKKWEVALNAGHKKFVAKTPIARWAETLRVAEGRPLRDKAKEDAHEKIAVDMKKFDDSYQSRKEVEKESDSSSVNEKDHQGSFDIFERLKRDGLKNLGAKKQ